jgi:hypothetical protein
MMRRRASRSSARGWRFRLHGLPLLECVRDQIAVTVAMVDALDVQIGPFDKQRGRRRAASPVTRR